MRRIAIALAACLMMPAGLVMSAGSSGADDALMRKSGEWQVTVNRDDAGKGAAPQTRKICYGTDQPLGDYATRGMKDCSRKDVVPSGKVLTITAVCTFNGAPFTVQGTIAATGKDAYHSEEHIHFDQPAEGMPADVAVKTDAKRLGACQPNEPAQ